MSLTGVGTSFPGVWNSNMSTHCFTFECKSEPLTRTSRAFCEARIFTSNRWAWFKSALKLGGYCPRVASILTNGSNHCKRIDSWSMIWPPSVSKTVPLTNSQMIIKGLHSVMTSPKLVTDSRMHWIDWMTGPKSLSSGFPVIGTWRERSRPTGCPS